MKTKMREKRSQNTQHTHSIRESLAMKRREAHREKRVLETDGKKIILCITETDSY